MKRLLHKDRTGIVASQINAPSRVKNRYCTLIYNVKLMTFVIITESQISARIGSQENKGIIPAEQVFSGVSRCRRFFAIRRLGW